jgi:uncharacterized protein (TIGR03118 family)
MLSASAFVRWWNRRYFQKEPGASNRPPASRNTTRQRLGVESLECRAMMSASPATVYLQTNLISDESGVAAITDPAVVNAWGLALPPTSGNFWLSNNGTATSSVYGGDVHGSPLVNKIPPAVAIPGSSPTGVVFNTTTDFKVSDGAGHSGAAAFIFVAEDGSITGWNPAVPPPPPSRSAQLGTTVAGAIYKGVAIGNDGSENLLYAANFHTGRIDVFDTHFAAKTLPGNFTDPHLAAGYAPFNIANIGGVLYVTYAQQDAARADEVAGAGKGFVDRFDTNGNFLGRFATRGPLDAPWGMVQAPDNFGRFSGDILVGNFGDGRIEAYRPANGSGPGRFEGFLQDASGKPLAIDGLWGLVFGNGSSGDVNSLYFTAGPDDESHGLFGKLSPANDLRSSGHVAVQLRLTSVDFQTGTFQADLVVRNLSKQPISGPILIVFDRLPAGATLSGATGTTADGKPFISLAGPLAPHGKTTVSITFTASRQQFGRTLSSLVRAAVVQPQVV